jgi:hypothetical protein
VSRPRPFTGGLRVEPEKTVPSSSIATPGQLVARAQEQTGLSDFGADGWQEGLGQLLSAASVDVGDDAAGRGMVEAMAVGRLANRLRIEHWYADHADEARDPVEGPIVIVGLPRTATTALQYLLALDPQLRYQRRWELTNPIPPPDITTERDDPRRLAATATATPQHIATADGPIEDGPALAFDFRHQELGLPLPTYTRWWRHAEMTTTYAYHERVLRLLHAHRPPRRWLLKAPSYLFNLTDFATQYPNARFLWTHRDPAVAIPSACSVIRTAQDNMLPSHRRDPFELGAFVLEHYIEGIRLATTARATLGEHVFFDVSQLDVDTNPISTMETIYAFLGLHLTDDVRSAIERWNGENRRGSRGEHRYAAEEFGLTARQISDAFRGYIDRFIESARRRGD